MPGRLLLLLWAASFGAACALRPDVGDPSGERGFAIDDPSAGSLAPPARVCLEAHDFEADVDLTAYLVAGLRARRPGFTNDCAYPFRGWKIDYQAGRTSCAHCGRADFPRFGFALVLRVEPTGITSLGDWRDTQGGTSYEVAARFAEDLAAWLENPDAPRRR